VKLGLVYTVYLHQHMIEGCREVAWKDSREQLIKTSGKAWRGCAQLGGEGHCEEDKKVL
jgi:hypothetical protein